jgi:hypothetical protein
MRSDGKCAFVDDVRLRLSRWGLGIGVSGTDSLGQTEDPTHRRSLQRRRQFHEKMP